MTGDFCWVEEEKDANFMYGGERLIINDDDIKRLKNGEILNFFVNDEYGCILKYVAIKKKR